MGYNPEDKLLNINLEDYKEPQKYIVPKYNNNFNKQFFHDCVRENSKISSLPTYLWYQYQYNNNLPKYLSDNNLRFDTSEEVLKTYERWHRDKRLRKRAQKNLGGKYGRRRLDKFINYFASEAK